MALNSKTLPTFFDEDDLLLLNTIQSRKYSLVQKLEDISDAQCKHLFRFNKAGINDRNHTGFSMHQLHIFFLEWNGCIMLFGGCSLFQYIYAPHFDDF